MTPRELFLAMLDVPAAERAAALAATDVDDETKELVRSLLDLDSEDSALDDVSQVVEDAVRDVSDTTPVDLPGLEVLGELGKGGMGVVYLAEQASPRRRVAVKTLLPLQRDPLALGRFRDEVEAAAKVRHPNVPAVYELLETEAHPPLLLLEYVAGKPMDEATATWSAARRLELVRWLTDVVHAVHEAGIVHRDLKPSNVLITDDGAPMVLDFGIAGLGGADGIASGRPGYMAPETRTGAAVAPTADVYALGVLGLQLTAGLQPGRDVEPLQPELLQQVSRPLAAVWTRACAEDPAARYPTAAALRDDLDRVLNDELPEALDVSLADVLLSARARYLPGLLRRARVVVPIVVAVLVGAWFVESERRSVYVTALEEQTLALHVHDPAGADFVSGRMSRFTAMSHTEARIGLRRTVVEPEHAVTHAAWAYVLGTMSWEADNAYVDTFGQILAEAGRWDAVRTLVAMMEGACRNEVGLLGALADRDHRRALACTYDELRPLLEPLTGFVPDPDAAVAETGPRYSGDVFDAGVRVRMRPQLAVALDGERWGILGQPADADAAVVVVAGSDGIQRARRSPVETPTSLHAADVDGDGVLEMLVGADDETWVYAPASDAWVPWPGLRVLGVAQRDDDAADELAVDSSLGRGWLGVGTTPMSALPALAVLPPPPMAEAGPGQLDIQRAARLWQMRLPDEGARRLSAMVDRLEVGSEDALWRAVALTRESQPEWAARLVREALAFGLTFPTDRATLATDLAPTHDVAMLRALDPGRWTAVDAAMPVLSTRWPATDPLAVERRGEVGRLSTWRDGPVATATVQSTVGWEVSTVLALDELAPGASVVLAAGGVEARVGHARTGPCSAAWTGAPVTLSVSWLEATGRVRCAVGDAVHLVEAESSSVTAVLSTEGRVAGTWTDVVVRGATVDAVPAWTEDPHLAGLVRARRSGTIPLIDATSVTPDVLRAAPGTWLPAVVAVLGETFPERWLAAGVVDPDAWRHPALAVVVGPGAETVRRRHGEALLDGGRPFEAVRVLQDLETPEAAWLLGRALLTLGRTEDARVAVGRYLAAAGDDPLACDRVHDQPAFRDLVRCAPSPVVRLADVRPLRSAASVERLSRTATRR
jgi:predicted Ser/Thr protein kinase